MVRPASRLARSLPSARVAIASCHEYGPGVTASLATMFDQLGGLESLVRGKTVAIKLNMTGTPDNRWRYLAPELTHWVHPDVVGATVHLLGQAGAYRIRLLESPQSTDPLSEFMLAANWDPRSFSGAAQRVEFENTNYLGYGKKYSRFMVPGGGLMYQGYDLNHSYEDCDVFVSLAKLKEHVTAGVTLSMKNCFGMTPCTIYGDRVPVDEPSVSPMGGRGIFHEGKRLPARSAPAPSIVHQQPREPGQRVPRVVADLVAARPIHLAVIDGIQSLAGGELPGYPTSRPVKPGLLIAGTNCVSTDAVGTALMGFDPMATHGTPPFETADSTLELAEQLGVGTRDLSQIEIIGPPISKVRVDYCKVPFPG